MKVTEIISEVWYNPMTWGKPTATDADKVAKAVEKVSPKEAAAALKNIKKDPAAYLKVINKRIAAGEFAKDIELAKNSGISRMGGVWWNALKLAGLAAATYELWAHLAVVDAAYMAGQRGVNNPDKTGLATNMPGDASMEFNEQDYKDWRRFYIGMWEAQVALPAIVSLIKAVSKLFFITRAIVAVLAGLGSIATLGGSLLGFATTELLTQAIQMWLISPAGQEWLLKNMWGPLVLAGEVGEDAWLILYKGVSGVKKAVASGDVSDIAKGNNFYADKKADRAKNPELAKRDAAMGDMDDVNTGKNAVVVGGVRITDAEGYLLPGIETAPSVKYAITYGTKAEKDAFAKVKAKGTNLDKDWVSSPEPAYAK
jgi:hypothetical protein